MKNFISLSLAHLLETSMCLCIYFLKNHGPKLLTVWSCKHWFVILGWELVVKDDQLFFSIVIHINAVHSFLLDFICYKHFSNSSRVLWNSCQSTQKETVIQSSLFDINWFYCTFKNSKICLTWSFAFKDFVSSHPFKLFPFFSNFVNNFWIRIPVSYQTRRICWKIRVPVFFSFIFQVLNNIIENINMLFGSIVIVIIDFSYITILAIMLVRLLFCLLFICSTNCLLSIH